ncbi:hypothetical protein CDL15_Pgr008235 [Punica granatum]|uniref:Uncharacterized protein n=1 Tax=Punica granatum TaxID=22663 RepID=A0A218VUW6_PUNGR|nr:hypothetical protein CDL15_Pgr008235 [Punica granatum]
MAPKLPSPLFPLLVFVVLTLLFLHSSLLSSPRPQPQNLPRPPSCNLFNGRWVQDPNKPKPLYDETCPFHRNAWNCLRNQRENMAAINSWKWVPDGCALDRVDPTRFLTLMRNRNIGFVGDSLNENFVVAFLCALRAADSGAKKWKRKGAWRGAHFPKFNVTVAYHRAVLLANYGNNGVNKEARLLNNLIREAVQGSDIRVLDLTHLSEFRADAHPAIWLGKKDAVQEWGQDCMHWCLPGVPDTWVDILAQLIRHSFESQRLGH